MSSLQRPVSLDQGKIRRALGDPDTPALVLFLIALYDFGDEVMGNPEEGVEPMDPSLMWKEFNERYGTWVSEEGENKLNAIVTGLQGGMFWIDEEVFQAVATALYEGDMGDLINSQFEDLSSTEIMWAILEMELAWDSDETPDFSFSIKQYIESQLLKEQENHDENAREIETAYLAMLKQLQELGIPASMIRAWDEEYALVMEELADGEV